MLCNLLLGSLFRAIDLWQRNIEKKNILLDWRAGIQTVVAGAAQYFAISIKATTQCEFSQLIGIKLLFWKGEKWGAIE